MMIANGCEAEAETTSKTRYCHGENMGGFLFFEKKGKKGVKKGKMKDSRLSRSSSEAQHHLPIILFMRIMAWNDNVTGNL
jgi:hypothetical protein